MFDAIDLKEQLERGDNYIRTTKLRNQRMWGLFALLLLGGFFLPSLLNLNLANMGLLVQMLPFALAFVPIHYFGKQNRKEVQNRAANIRKRLPDLLPEMKEYVPLHLNTAKKGFDAIGLLNRCILLGLGVLFLYCLYISSYLGLIFTVLAFYLFGTMGKMLLRLFEPNLDTDNRAYILRLTVWSVIFLFITFLPGFLFQQWLATWLQGTLNLSIYQSLILLLILSLPIFWVMLYLYALAPHFYIASPAAHGDFETSLRRGMALSRLMPKQLNVMFAYGWVLLIAGRWQEAEKLWRDFIQENQNSGVGVLSSALINLAVSLLGQERDEEAKPLLEAAVKIRPEHATVYRELALWYLENEVAPQRALELSQICLHFAKKPRLNYAGQLYSWAGNLCTHAFALASNGQQQEALLYLERAFAENDQKNIYAQGFVRFYAGQVHRVLGNKEDAARYYQEAIALHPSYSVHQFAKKALAELDASIA